MSHIEAVRPTASARPLSTSRWRVFPLWLHSVLVVLALALMMGVNGELQNRYDATGYPVTFFEGQTTFSGTAVKGHWAELAQLGTLEAFAQVQQFDFIFMACVAAFGVLGGLLIVRLTSGRLGRTIGYTTVVAAITGALSDALENVVSFVMLADPTGFADALAITHSGFAVLKFAGMTVAMLAGTVGAVIVIMQLVRSNRSRRDG